MVMYLLRSIAWWWRRRRAWARARRHYRALCRDGHSPVIRFMVQLHEDDVQWHAPSGHNGLTEVKTLTRLDRHGRRYIAATLRDLEETCIRQVLADQSRNSEQDGGN